MLVLPNYAKHYASEIDKSLAESRTCSTKDLTLFMKRLSRVRKNRARAKERLCLKGVRQGSETSSFVFYRVGHSLTFRWYTSTQTSLYNQ